MLLSEWSAAEEDSSLVIAGSFFEESQYELTFRSYCVKNSYSKACANDESGAVERIVPQLFVLVLTNFGIFSIKIDKLSGFKI